VWGQDPHSNIVTLMDSALVFNHLNDLQSRCQQNLPYFTTNWEFAQIQNLRSYIFFTLHYLDGICKMYPTYMFAYQSAAQPLHKLSIIYISTVLPERFFTRDDGCTKKDMKLFHKFIDIFGLMHVHSTRENQSCNRKCQFL
jgi:hypothetical protein